MIASVEEYTTRTIRAGLVELVIGWRDVVVRYPDCGSWRCSVVLRNSGELMLD
jgi:hypothetical protein